MDFLVALAYVPIGVLVGALLAMLTGPVRPSARRVVPVAALCGLLVGIAALLAIGYENTGAP